MHGEDLRPRIQELDRWGTSRDWIGPDPYEGLNARRVSPIGGTPVGRRLLIQAVKRSPVDLRKPLGIAPRPNAATLGHVLSAYAAMARSRLIAVEEFERRLDRLVDTLLALRSPDFTESCWGYPFDVQTRFFFYPRSSPNTIASAFVGLGLLDAHALTGQERLRDLIEDLGRFFVRRLPLTETQKGAYFGYLPDDRTPIHNANLLACEFLSRLAALNPDQGLRETVRKCVSYTLAHQRPDGSWRYAEGPLGDWIDGYHTGYVLDSLERCAQELGEARIHAAYERGLGFYAARLVDGGVPRFTVDSRYPVDGQCVAQAIHTFSLAARHRREWLDRALAVYGFAVSRMRRSDGSFAFQRGRIWSKQIAHVRWVQAPMLAALATLHEVVTEVNTA